MIRDCDVIRFAQFLSKIDTNFKNNPPLYDAYAIKTVLFFRVFAKGWGLG
jgi:hypothetical protein